MSTVQFHPRPHPMTQKSETNSFGWLKLAQSVPYLLGKDKLRYLGLSSLLIMLQFNSVIAPLLMGKIVDFFTGYSPGMPLTRFYALVGLIGGLQIVASYLRLSFKREMGLMASNISYTIRVQGFQKLMDLSLAWHDAEVTGNKFQRIQNGTMALRQLIRLMNNEVYGSLTSLVGMILVFAFMQPIYIMLVGLYTGIFILMLRYYYNQTSKLQEEQNAAIEQASGTYVEGLGNILSIKATGSQSNFTQSVSKTEAVRKVFEQRLTTVSIRKWQLYQVFNGIMAVIFLLLIGRDVTMGTISVGSILVVNSYVQQLISRSADILDVYDQLIAHKSSVGRMMNILWSDDIPKGGSNEFPANWDTIKMRDISFSYAGSAGLKDISLTISRSQKIGIVGQTGSGKSTIAKVMLGLYPFERGDYLIGNERFEDISHASVAKHMSIVLQESEMFNMSVRENITLMRDIDDQTLLHAIKIAQLEGVIEKLPQGLETLIGEKGYHLSGGERQRIGIARAICQNPEVIIFDEATSSLDSHTESRIQHALEKDLKKKTLIFIAHRISTLKNVDIVYVFDNGEIVESGSYNGLIANKNSLFNKLYMIQEQRDLS